MIKEIENKIIEKLQAANLNVKDFDNKAGFKSLIYPAVFVATEKADFERVTQTTVRCNLSIVISVFFKHPRSESERRNGINPILQSIVQTLLFERLDLKISPIMIKSFQNKTTSRLIDENILLFQIDLKTSYKFTKDDDSEAKELLKISVDYYLNNINDNETAISSNIELEESI